MNALTRYLALIGLATCVGGCTTATVITETGESKIIHETPLTASDAGFDADSSIPE